MEVKKIVEVITLRGGNFEDGFLKTYFDDVTEFTRAITSEHIETIYETQNITYAIKGKLALIYRGVF